MTFDFFFLQRFRVGKLRSRIQRVFGVVRFVHSFRYVRHVTVTAKMVYTGRLFNGAVAHTHHELHQVAERKRNLIKLFHCHNQNLVNHKQKSNTTFDPPLQTKKLI